MKKYLSQPICLWVAKVSGVSNLLGKHRWNIAIFHGKKPTDFRNPSGSHGPVGEEYRRNNENTLLNILITIQLDLGVSNSHFSWLDVFFFHPFCWAWTLLPSVTPPETNIPPENRPSQMETHFPTIHFQVLCWFQGGYICGASSQTPGNGSLSNLGLQWEISCDLAPKSSQRALFPPNKSPRNFWINWSLTHPVNLRYCIYYRYKKTWWVCWKG